MTTALSRCLQEEAAAISAASHRLDPNQVEAALLVLENCRKRRAKMLITGVGKSGIVARKIAATFSSIGLTAVFLNPLDALHGDLGIVNTDDVVLLLSNSGETSELLAMLPHLRLRGNVRIALVGRTLSTLAKGCDVVLDASVDREICPLNLAPTASTAVAMAIGDALAAVWMERSGISSEQFAFNHPAGAIGRELTLTVADLMVPVQELPPLEPDTPLPVVIGHLTKGSPSRGSLGACWIASSHAPTQIVGLITDGDLRRTLQRYGPDEWPTITASWMATTDPITVYPHELAISALQLMESNRRKSISVLPVISSKLERDFVGLLRLHDLIRAGFSLSPTSTIEH